MRSVRRVAARIWEERRDTLNERTRISVPLQCSEFLRGTNTLIAIHHDVPSPEDDRKQRLVSGMGGSLVQVSSCHHAVHGSMDETVNERSIGPLYGGQEDRADLWEAWDGKIVRGVVLAPGWIGWISSSWLQLGLLPWMYDGERPRKTVSQGSWYSQKKEKSKDS